MSALSDLVKYAQVGDVRYVRAEYNELYSRANEAAAELVAKDERIADLEAIVKVSRKLMNAHDKQTTNGYLVIRSDGETEAWLLFSEQERDEALSELEDKLIEYDRQDHMTKPV